MVYKLDLHTHSDGSPDGGLKTADYRYFLENKLLDYIAITDHNSIATAQAIKAELGDVLGERIIIGEEVMTSEGEVIGLYLNDAIPAGLSLTDTVAHIHKQKGLVYVPHPFETVRSGVSQTALRAVLPSIDIIEVHNGRALFQNRSKLACATATQYQLSRAASSDAHGRFGWGYTYSVVNRAPTRENLVRQLTDAGYSTRTVGWGILYPKFNRLRKSFGGTK